MALAQDRDWERPPLRPVLVPAEPRFEIPSAALVAWRREPAIILPLRDTDLLLDATPGEPLGSLPVASPVVTRRKTAAAVATSVFVHVAAALFFTQLTGDDVQIAGGDKAEVAMLGNAPEDSSVAGEQRDSDGPEVTSVTILTMLDAEPVTAADESLTRATAEQIFEAEVIEPVASEDMEAIAAAETVPPQRLPVEVVPLESVPEAVTALSPVADAAGAPETVSALPAPDSLIPEILVADPPDLVEPADVAAVHSEHAVSVQSLAVAPAVPVDAQPVVQPSSEVVVEKPARAAEPLQPVPDEPVVKKPALPKRQPVTKKPALAKAKPVEIKTEKARPVRTAEGAKARETTKRPVGKSATKSGSQGRGQVDSRRGEADGAVQGRSTAKGKDGARKSAAGNAAVTNYPGKIISKLRRALRYPAQARSQKLRGEVQVSFTVSASGGVSGVRVVRSSGSPLLDRAAIDTVRRAAPFPAIPDGAGRSNWPFTLPLAFTR